MEQLPQDFTLLLERHRHGDLDLRSQIMTAIYAELRRLAARYMSNERVGHTLQPTALVHEAWMRFAASNELAQNKAHFKALAAGVMKEVLIDHARKFRAAKRGGGENKIAFDESAELTVGGPEQLLGLCECIQKLKELSPRQAQLVELKVFGGLCFEEVAEELNLSLATVKRDWLVARAWLYRELS